MPAQKHYTHAVRMLQARLGRYSCTRKRHTHMPLHGMLHVHLQGARTYTGHARVSLHGALCVHPQGERMRAPEALCVHPQGARTRDPTRSIARICKGHSRVPLQGALHSHPQEACTRAPEVLRTHLQGALHYACILGRSALRAIRFTHATLQVRVRTPHRACASLTGAVTFPDR